MEFELARLTAAFSAIVASYFISVEFCFGVVSKNGRRLTRLITTLVAFWLGLVLDKGVSTHVESS
jgi:putative flippase GtrA